MQIYNFVTPKFDTPRPITHINNMPDINSGVGYYCIHNFHFQDSDLKKLKPFNNFRGIVSLAYDYFPFDLDCKGNLQAVLDNLKRMEDYLEVPSEAFQPLFSGNKGAHSRINILEQLDPEAAELLSPSENVIKRCKKIVKVLIKRANLTTVDLPFYSIQRLFPFPHDPHYETGLNRIPINLSTDTPSTIKERSRVEQPGILSIPDIKIPKLSQLILEIIPRPGNRNNLSYKTICEDARKHKSPEKIHKKVDKILTSAGMSQEEAQQDRVHKRVEEIIKENDNANYSYDREFINKIKESLNYCYEDMETSKIFAYNEENKFYTLLNQKKFEKKIKDYIIEKYTKYTAGKEKSIFESIKFPLLNLSTPNLEYVQFGSKNVDMNTFEFLDPIPEHYANIRFNLNASRDWEDLDNNPFFILLCDLYSVENAHTITDLFGSLIKKNLSRIFVFFGPPASGKTTIPNIIKTILKGRTSSWSLNEYDSFGMEELTFSLVNILDEFKRLSSSAVMFLKRSTGSQSSPIYLNPKFKRPFYITPPRIYTLTSNFRPSFNDLALKRRSSVIETTKKIKGDLNENYVNEIVKEYEQDIIDLILGASKRLSLNGFYINPNSPDSLFASTVELFLKAIKDGDISRLGFNVDKKIHRNKLFQIFSAFASDQSLEKINANAFYKEMVSQGFTEQRDGKGRYFKGFVLDESP